MKRIQISQVNIGRPDFLNSAFSKEKTTLNWLIDWIKEGLRLKVMAYGDLLPKKEEFAKYLSLSIGTVQNAIRRAEELNYVESKQSIGTMLKDPAKKDCSLIKMSSKKDKAVLEIKKYILEKKIPINSELAGVKEISDTIKTSSNTTRLALDTLVQQGFLGCKTVKGNKSLWFYLKEIELTKEEKNSPSGVENCTLINKAMSKMLDYIVNNYKQGDKILPNSDFAKMFNVSIRTVNEASKLLNEQKIILSRRGQYGTIYLNNPQKLQKNKDREEKSLFMSQGRTRQLKNSYLYSWEKTLDALKRFIEENHEAGDRIPSMKELAQILEVSTNTIRRAVSAMCEEGFLISQRGKYGGVFILEMPQKDSEAFTWLALNPDVIKTKK